MEKYVRQKINEYFDSKNTCPPKHGTCPFMYRLLTKKEKCSACNREVEPVQITF